MIKKHKVTQEQHIKISYF